MTSRTGKIQTSALVQYKRRNLQRRQILTRVLVRLQAQGQIKISSHMHG